ncbi:UDP-glucose dehydrogenase family protein [Limnofasciculus baicalensis]|uniref:UDP-glucose 6-dehydrogenase n=1 Tax=Limnofasciculus baicalensis BBK-W-15 TaxID=2699891 RepID=A0AAE3GND5_9CYAN|nr:nucleotide sugar dehydrogenase [Limnofasciculus baicalensis]MCP2727780.1 nucleotide sugar dehydrogenase [Limnofasciculus baicalensis BBK-W-15]
MSELKIGVVGLWHLGCVIAATWSKLGHVVRGIDFDETNVSNLSKGQPPIYEPELQETIQASLEKGLLSFSQNPTHLKDCSFVFLAYDTPVRDDDSSDLSILEEAIEAISAHLAPNTILIVSAQLPVGTARLFRTKLKAIDSSLEVVYSPENLRLGEAINCYLNPGHIVIGADEPQACQAVAELFSPMQAECLFMNLPSAEMTKHGINSFLATSITLANQWSDICAAVGADFAQVAAAMKCDPRIGKRAYLSPGIGFSGGTLGRDLQVLEGINQQIGNQSPIFGDMWRYNKTRVKVVGKVAEDALGNLQGKTITLLGMTYKPGTSTLRRSLPLEVAYDLVKRGASIRAYDPKADWNEAHLPGNFETFTNVYEAVAEANLVVLLTEWPEFKSLDFSEIRKRMTGNIFFDTKSFILERFAEIKSLGFTVLSIGRAS